MSDKKSLIVKFADRYGIEKERAMPLLMNTAFQSVANNMTQEQQMAFMIVADQYHLNPFTKEIYAFPDKKNGIIPVVGVDGWSRIINENKLTDGIEFRYSDTMMEAKGAKPCPEWCECILYRTDRTKPTVVREYLDEVYRPPFKGKYGDVIGPWQTHTKRMLRHKTLIQAARVAYGFAGIYDHDEAERIQESTVIDADFTATAPNDLNAELGLTENEPNQKEANHA